MENKDVEFINGENITLEELFAQELADEPDFLKNILEEPKAQPEQIQTPRVKPQVRKKKQPWQKSALVYLHDLVILLAVVIVVFLLCFRVVVVSGTSMNRTLLDGDYLLLLGNVFYQQPRAGDVIVASKDSFENGAPIVKRVIATEGQTVDIDFEAGVVYVDGTALEEPYTLTPTNLPEGVQFPQVVQPGCIFVLGDNRNGSKDSRNPEIGQIDNREVLGKVIFLFLPGTNDGTVQRDFGRIGVIS